MEVVVMEEKVEVVVEEKVEVVVVEEYSEEQGATHLRWQLPEAWLTTPVSSTTGRTWGWCNMVQHIAKEQLHLVPLAAVTPEVRLGV